MSLPFAIFLVVKGGKHVFCKQPPNQPLFFSPRPPEIILSPGGISNSPAPWSPEKNSKRFCINEPPLHSPVSKVVSEHPGLALLSLVLDAVGAARICQYLACYCLALCLFQEECFAYLRGLANVSTMACPFCQDVTAYSLILNEHESSCCSSPIQ